MINRIIELAQACFISEQEKDRKGEPANLIDGLFEVARAMDRLRAQLEKPQPADGGKL